MSTERHAQIDQLTRTNRSGAVLQRAADAEAQIRTALARDEATLIAQAHNRDYRSADYLKAETLVYLLRYFYRLQRNTLVDELAGVLVDRCTSFSRKRLAELEPANREDCLADVITALFSRILDFESDRGDFLQVRFWVFVKGLLLDYRRRHQLGQWRAGKNTSLDMAPDEDAGFAGDPTASAPLPTALQDTAPLDRRLLVQEALATLREPVRRAFLLRYFAGWPIEDQDPAVPTISAYFGKTSRTIRNWLSEAETTLRAWRANDGE